MKELGEYLKRTRISNGVSLTEACEDLEFSTSHLENIESGNVRAFKDVFSLKSKIKSYAKYLGLHPEKVADEFNDFMFEHTSKISLSDILEAEKKANDEIKKKVHSPYTKIRKKKVNTKGIAIFIGALLIVIILIIILMKLLEPRDPIINQELSKKGVEYEFTY